MKTRIDWGRVGWIAFVAVAVASAVLAIGFAIRVMNQSERETRDCRSAGYAIMTPIGDARICVGLDVETGEPIAERLDVVRARLGGE